MSHHVLIRLTCRMQVIFVCTVFVVVPFAYPLPGISKRNVTFSIISLYVSHFIKFKYREVRFIFVFFFQYLIKKGLAIFHNGVLTPTNNQHKQVNCWMLIDSWPICQKLLAGPAQSFEHGNTDKMIL